MTQTSLTDAKAHLSAYAQDVVRTHERLSITRNGRRELVLVAADDLDALEETLDILASSELMDDIREGRREIAQGRIGFERPVIGQRSDDA